MRSLTKTGLTGWILLLAWLLPAWTWAMASTPVPANFRSTSPQSDAAKFFEEPLLARRQPTSVEQRELAFFLSVYRTANPQIRASLLARYLHEHPRSPWASSLRLNLGLIAAHRGFVSRALDAWESVWREGRDDANPASKPATDRALAELLHLHGRLGHAERVARLLKESEGRAIPAIMTESLALAREGLWQMRNHPGEAFRCGPIALAALLAKTGHADSSALQRLLFTPLAGPNGTSLQALDRLARQSGLRHRLAFRTSKQAIPTPSIAHLRQGHYAAILEHDGRRYRVRDPVFGGERWLDVEALNEETSGYFIVPAQSARTGWRHVDAREAAQVLGAGYTAGNDPSATSPEDSTDCDPDCGGSGSSRGLPRYSVHSMLVSLHIDDTPLGYQPPKGPDVQVTLSYNQREASQPTSFDSFNLGPKWTLNWLSYVQDDPASPGNRVTRAVAGGGSRAYSGYDAATGAFAPETRNGSQLVRVSASGYERRLADGSREIYGQPDGRAVYPRKVFLTRIVDRAGNAVSLEYDAQLRLTAIVDALGQRTTFQYGNADPLLITGVSDPFGRSASIEYDALGRLAALTDGIGMRSTFSYDAGYFITTMTTPYGETRFSYGESGSRRWLQITDPQGESERVEFLHGAPGIPFSDTPQPAGIATFNAYLNGRDSYYWDKHAMRVAPGDYTKARIKHFLHGLDTSLTSPILESVKYPLENRIWYNYPGQSWAGGEAATWNLPSATARVLPDGTTQVSRKAYNGIGNLTRSIDPAGRETDFEYDANGIDLLRVKRKTATGFDVLAQYTYNAQHLPLTYTDAAGQVTTLTYNAAGQVTSVTNPKLEVTQYVYDANGYLTQILNPLGKPQTTYTYDAAGRVASTTDSERLTTHFAYDALDRVLSLSYPDGTTRTFTWDKLDLVARKDREGRITRYAYDAVRNLVQEIDPLGRITRYGYHENGRLKTLTDPLNRVTTWERDLEGRVTAKVLADGSRSRIAYDTASRIDGITDALGQTRRHRYGTDGLLTGITYENAVNPTPAVTFAYDPDYPRLVSMLDGTGLTTYSYQPAGQLGAGQLLDEIGQAGPIVTVHTDYDVLGRPIGRSVDSAVETYAYDGLGRLSRHTNPLGTFSYGYLGQTGQPTRQTLAGKAFRIDYQYESNLRDRQLKGILNRGFLGLPAGRSFFYQHSAEHRVTAKSFIPTLVGERYRYDDADRLTGVSLGFIVGDWVSTGSASDWSHLQAGVPLEDFQYDDGDNLIGKSGLTGGWSATVDNVNAIGSANGVLWAHDANGNVLDDGQRQYAWDAENRLIGITDKTTGATTQMRYDGLSRRVAITDKASPTASPLETRYLWCGEQLCQARDSLDRITRRYYPQGELQGTTRLYYASDHLGSVTDVVDANGFLQGVTGDSAYGETVLQIAAQTDKGYAGMLRHAPSGLYLTQYRVYDPRTGRWLSRDPIGEMGGVNLYAYVGGNPVSRTDSQGLFWDLLDFGFFAHSLYNYSQCPSPENAVNLGLDALGLLPGIPAIGTIRHVGEFADVAKGARDAAVEFTNEGERFIRVGAGPENLKFTFETPGGVRAGTYAFPEKTFLEIGRDPAALKNFGDLPGAPPQYFRILEPPAGTPIQRGIVPGGEFGGVGGVPEVLFPEGF